MRRQLVLPPASTRWLPRPRTIAFVRQTAYVTRSRWRRSGHAEASLSRDPSCPIPAARRWPSGMHVVAAFVDERRSQRCVGRRCFWAYRKRRTTRRDQDPDAHFSEKRSSARCCGTWYRSQCRRAGFGRMLPRDCASAPGRACRRIGTIPLSKDPSWPRLASTLNARIPLIGGVGDVVSERPTASAPDM
jgi:hypothetical protein